MIGNSADGDPCGVLLHRVTDQRNRKAGGRLSGKNRSHGRHAQGIERGYVQQEIQNAAYEYQQAVDRRTR